MKKKKQKSKTKLMRKLGTEETLTSTEDLIGPYKMKKTIYWIDLILQTQVFSKEQSLFIANKRIARLQILKTFKLSKKLEEEILEKFI